MNRAMKKLAAVFLMLAFAVAVPGYMFPAYAATGKLTFSDPSVTVGNEVSVTMKIATGDGTLGKSDVMLEYDASALEFKNGTNANGGAGQIRVTGSMESANQTVFTFSLRFKALKAGSTAIRVVSQEVYDADDRTVTLSHVGSSAVTVNASSSSSGDAALASLTISPGTLSPAFSEDITDYTATVYGDTTSVAVSAPAKSSGASVSVSGHENLQVGENAIVCTVTAENGTTKTYTITVTKVEGEAPEGSEAATEPQGNVNIAVDEGNWQVAESFDASLLPEGFTQTEYSYEGRPVQAGIDEQGNVLLYMTDENGNGDFFFYDVSTNTLSQYVTVLMAEKTIIVLSPDMIPAEVSLPEGFAPCNIDIGSHTVHGWIWSDSSETPEYCVVYGMNADGERNFYRYDQKEMTLQRYFADPDAESLRAQYVALAEEHNSLIEDYNTRGTIIAALFGVCIVLVIVMVVLLLMKNRRPKNGYDSSRERYVIPEDDDDYRRKPARNGRAGDGAGRETARRSGGTAAVREEARPSRDEDRPARPKRRVYEEEPGIEDLDLEEDERPVRPARSAETEQGRRRPSGSGENAGNEPVNDVTAVEKNIAAALAKEATEAASGKEADDEDDDFEFIDLDL